MHFSLVQNFRTVNCIITFFGKTETQRRGWALPGWCIYTCLSNKATWTRKNRTRRSFWKLECVFKKKGSQTNDGTGDKTSQKSIMSILLHISNPCCNGPFSHDSPTPSKKPNKNLPVAWWWCSWFLIVTIDTAQTAEEAGTLKVLQGFVFSGSYTSGKLRFEFSKSWKALEEHNFPFSIGWFCTVQHVDFQGCNLVILTISQYRIHEWFQFTQLQDICIVSVYIPGTQMTFLFEGQPFKNKAEIPIKTAGSFGFQVPNIFPAPWGFFRR